MAEVEKSRLDELAEEINQEHQAFRRAFKATFRSALKAGDLLNQAKAQVGHGNWTSWVEENCAFSIRTAQTYMRIARNRPLIEEAVKNEDPALLNIASAQRAVAELRQAHPFFELLDYVRTSIGESMDRAREEMEGSERLEAEFWAGVEDPLKITVLEEHTVGARVHSYRAAYAMLNACLEFMRGLDHVEHMWTEHGEEEMAAGWLREYMILMSQGSHGGFGASYQTALWFARGQLLMHVPDGDFRSKVESRVAGNLPMTFDLTDEERTVLGALAPEQLKAVDEAWEEDKDYELAMRQLETFTRPADIPPSREQGDLKELLSEEQMQITFSVLRETGVL